ncbi:MAG: CBASS cGAMP synthase [Caulobacter sp.]|nr:CBASS cGAMP synthase [Caulobacter sp.]
MYNAHKLFYRPSSRPCLKSALVLSEIQREKLIECRQDIRTALREGLRSAGGFLPRQEYYREEFLAKASQADSPDLVLRPKFRTQGSWAYDTLNRPAHVGQQIDLDEGMYVPMSMMENAHPTVASSALYTIVETILGQLCIARGWELDTSKSICIRVLIDAETHVDVNIYAVPDAQVRLIEKRAAATTGMTFDSSMTLDLETLRQIRLDPNQIYVAHRRKGWEQSDPLQLEEWFIDAADKHSAWTDLRRIVRYLKAWRDYRWESSTLNSLSLMVCAVEALDEANTPPIANRDDDGLLVVARALAKKVAGDIRNPVIPDALLNGHWSVTERNNFELAARVLKDELQAALELEQSANGVVQRLRKLFGPRIPNDDTLVSGGLALEQIRSAQPKQTPSPKVGTSTSG